MPQGVGYPALPTYKRNLLRERFGMPDFSVDEDETLTGAADGEPTAGPTTGQENTLPPIPELPTGGFNPDPGGELDQPIDPGPVPPPAGELPPTDGIPNDFPTDLPEVISKPLPPAVATPTGVPGSFATPGQPGSLDAFRSPNFTTGRTVGPPTPLGSLGSSPPAFVPPGQGGDDRGQEELKRLLRRLARGRR